MSRHRNAQTALLFALLLLPERGLAQDVAAEISAREGFWIGFGFGPALLSFECEACRGTGDDDPWQDGSGAAIWFSLGGAVSESLLIGAATNLADIGTVVGGDGSSRSGSLSSLLFVARYFPRPGSNFFLEGGFGFGGASLEDDFETVVEANGWAAHVGTGYDFRFGGRFAISPVAAAGLLLSHERIVDVDGRTVGLRRNPHYLQAGLQMSWY